MRVASSVIRRIASASTTSVTSSTPTRTRVRSSARRGYLSNLSLIAAGLPLPAAIGSAHR